MSVTTAQFLVNLLTAYVAAGAMFATVFLRRWVGRVDALAEHGTIGFRLLVFPGVTALWPLFAVRLARGASAPPDEWTAHRRAVRDAHPAQGEGRR